MTREEALQIIERTATDYTQPNCILQGLQILSRYYQDMDLEIACEHDILYAGGFTPEEMTRGDIITLAQLGWFQELDVWAHSV